MKKLIALVLILMLMVSALPTLADSVVIQDIGYIKYSIDGEVWVNAPEYIGDYGHRVAFQCSSALFPNAPWNYKFSDPEWKKIESTWIKVQVLVPENTISRIWAYSWKQGGNTYNGGYLLELDPGYYDFTIKNGEIQNWPKSEPFSVVDLTRIFQQKRDGNVNIKNPLAFTGITANLVERIPNDLVYTKVVVGPVTSIKAD